MPVFVYVRNKWGHHDPVIVYPERLGEASRSYLGKGCQEHKITEAEAQRGFGYLKRKYPLVQDDWTNKEFDE